jgi:PPOX class probable F420-dependent enzyme
VTEPRPDPRAEHVGALRRQPVLVMATVHPDGRPQLSLVRPWVHDGLIELTLTEPRVKTRNLRADPRAALIAVSDDGARFVVAEGRAELSPPSNTPGDETGRRLADLYRALAGEHPDWGEYHRVMVQDRRLVARIPIAHTYAGGSHA